MSQSMAVGEAETVPSLPRKLLSFGFTLLASVGSFGFFAVQGILLARMLGLEQRGVFAAAILFPQTLLYLGLLGAPELFAGYAAQGLDDTRLRRSAARYGLLAGMLSLLACLVLDYFVLSRFLVSPSVLGVAVLCALTMPMQQIRLSVQAVDHGQRQFKRYNHVRLAAAALFPAFLAAGMLAGFRDVTTACTLFFLSQLAGLGLVQFGMKGSWLGPGAVAMPQALHDARGLMGAWVATEMLERIDLVLLVLLSFDETVLGAYHTAVPIASLMTIVPNAAGFYAFNRGARSDERVSTKDAWRFLGLGIGVQVATGLALAAAVPLAIVWFYGAEFKPTIVFAWLLMPAAAFRGLLQACDSYLRARKKPVLGVKARVVAVPLMLLLTAVLLPSQGPNAIPIALSLAQLVCFLIVAGGVVQDTWDHK